MRRRTRRMRATCGRKVGHETEAGAWIARKKMGPDGWGLEAYRCVVCGKWHLGSTAVGHMRRMVKRIERLAVGVSQRAEQR